MRHIQQTAADTEYLTLIEIYVCAPYHTFYETPH
jgi:hypothetical protein